MCAERVDYTVRSMEKSPVADDTPIPEGRVKQMRQEWLVREDGVLAYKLQSQEISNHYEHNRESNKIVRGDLHTAKSVQRTEEEEMQLQREAYQRYLQQQAEEDERLAMELQRQLELEEREKTRRKAAIDEDIARRLQSAHIDHRSRPRRPLPVDADLEDERVLDEEAVKKLQEERDAEIARALQEQEQKGLPPSDHMASIEARDRDLAIEAQDYEYARMLQREERAKAKKAREKARQRAMARQQQTQHSQCDDGSGTTGSDDSGSLRYATSSSGGCGNENGGYSPQPTYMLASGQRNIAAELDPTLQSRDLADHQRQLPSRYGYGRAGSCTSSPESTLLNSSLQQSPTTNGHGGAPIYETLTPPAPPPVILRTESGLPPIVLRPTAEDYDEMRCGSGAVPPYMPLQALPTRKGPEQLISAPTPSDKLKSNGKKDNCKTQ